MIEVINENRLEQLQSLLEVLAYAIDKGPGARDLAQLSKQYRETLNEIDIIKGMTEENDEISDIISKRQADGKSKPVR